MILLILLKITLSPHLFCQHSLENAKIMYDVSLKPSKKNLIDLDKMLNLLTLIMTKIEFHLTILFIIKQKSVENKEHYAN